ncbi:MAG: ATPase [Coprothermobacterota bacterium]|nr:ATPase [Coprothermobacterota bacterium]
MKKIGTLEILEEIETLIDQGKKIPFTHNVTINMDRMLELLDQIRENFPQELSQAKWVLQEKRRLLDEAQQEADRIIQSANAKAQAMLQENEIMRRAEEKAREVYQRAVEEARTLKRDAEAYAEAILAKLEANIEKMLSTVKASRSQLRSSIAQASQVPATQTTKTNSTS